MASVIATKTHTKYVAGSNRVAARIVAGDVYKTTQKVYRVFGADCFAARPRGNSFTYDQFEFMIQTYENLYPNCQWADMVDECMSSTLFTDRDPAGVHCYFSIIRAMDSFADERYHTEYGGASKVLEDVMDNVSPDRYMTRVSMMAL